MSRKKVPLATEYGARVSQVSGKRGKGRRTSRVLPSLRRLAESNDFTAGELSCGFAPKLNASTMCWNPTDTSNLFDHYRVVSSIAAIAVFVCAAVVVRFGGCGPPHSIQNPRTSAIHSRPIAHFISSSCQFQPTQTVGCVSVLRGASCLRSNWCHFREASRTGKTEASEFDSCATAAQP
jgi:hypothetical protein